MGSCVYHHPTFVLHRSTNTRHVLLLHTFLSRPGRSGFTVHALKLVEIGTDLDLIHNALFKCREDDSALRRDLHILGLPRSW